MKLLQEKERNIKVKLDNIKNEVKIIKKTINFEEEGSFVSLFNRRQKTRHRTIEPSYPPQYNERINNCADKRKKIKKFASYIELEQHSNHKDSDDKLERIESAITDTYSPPRRNLFFSEVNILLTFHGKYFGYFALILQCFFRPLQALYL